MKFKYMAMAAIAFGAAFSMASCSGSAKSGENDSDSATEVVADSAKVEDTASADAVFDSIKASGSVADSTVYTTETGLKYMIIQKGEGATPTATDDVTVHYTGKLVDGTVFDSSVDRGEPATFPLNRVIPGWTEGLQLMQEGGKAVFYIPAKLAYGEQGIPGVIPPSSDLVFEVELLKVVKP